MDHFLPPFFCLSWASIRKAAFGRPWPRAHPRGPHRRTGRLMEEEIGSGRSPPSRSVGCRNSSVKKLRPSIPLRIGHHAVGLLLCAPYPVRNPSFDGLVAGQGSGGLLRLTP